LRSYSLFSAGIPQKSGSAQANTLNALEIRDKKRGEFLSTVFVISGESDNKTVRLQEKVCNLRLIVANFGVEQRGKVDLHRFPCTSPADRAVS
jgi:hypothetical protein